MEQILDESQFPLLVLALVSCVAKDGLLTLILNFTLKKSFGQFLSGNSQTFVILSPSF